MGFERITAVLQNKRSNYDTDLFTPLLAEIGRLSGHPYSATAEPLDTSMRVVADHIRATTFLIADGVIPSNEWRGYVLRKIMRRAMRHGKHLGISEPFLYRLPAVLDREMGDAYPEIRANRELVEKTILAEEKRFDAVLTDGLPRLEAEIAKALESDDRVLPGVTAFRLYDTFGLPYDFIEDTAATQDVTVDRSGYERAMERQRDKARARSAFEGTRQSDDFEIVDEAALKKTGDQFVGYASTRLTGVSILALYDDRRRPIDGIAKGRNGYMVLARTPFYLEAGGQVSDTGRIFNETTGASAAVEGIVRIRTGFPRAHRVQVTDGTFRPGDIVTAEVDADIRDATRRNHTATHLLHAALREVLGSHVKQKGSLVAPDRLRFDFVHLQPLTREEHERIEEIVNRQIFRNVPVQTEIRPTEEAIKAGAMALFGEKYGDRVRVVTIPDFSVELCGGTHVAATGDIGPFVILAETGVAAGVRRIEAVTGAGAVQWMQCERSTLASLIETLHVNRDQAVEAIEKLQSEAKRLSRDVTQLKTALALGGTRADAEDTTEIAGITLARRKLAGLDKDALRQLADTLKTKIKSGIVVLASANDGKVQMVVAVTADLVAKVKAGQIVKELAPIVGGSGGGRPDFAEAGGKQPDRIDEMLQATESVIAKLLAG
jgi:alanyl-tRNA synthetase